MAKLTIQNKPTHLIKQYREAGHFNDDTLYQLLADRAADMPDKPALVTDTGQQLTYAEWNDRVLRLAGALRAMGVEKGDIVGVQLPNIPEFFISFLAISSLGAVMQTMHMPYRAAELRFLLTHSGAKCFIGTSGTVEYSPVKEAVQLQNETETLTHIITVGSTVDGTEPFDELLLLTHEPATNLPSLVGDDAFILLYTSGTTGNPKGVPIKYNWFMNNARIAVDDWQFVADDVVLSAASYTHLYGLWTIILTLYVGATNALMKPFTPPGLVEAINTLKPTGLFAVPAHIAALINTGLWDTLDTSTIRFICQAGIIVPTHIAQAIDDKLENGCVIQMFGMSELQAGSYTRITDPAHIRVSTSGTPPAGMELKIVDDQGQELSPNEEGRLLFRGNAVFTGYLNNEAATKEIFDDDAWFETGDTATLTESGHLKITGRIKDIINRGGIKYHPKEVEDLVIQMAGVLNAAVVPYPDDVLGERACIFIEKAADTPLALSDITDALKKARIAKFKWPERLEFVDAMPLTPTRKIIRGELARLL
ncbi:MAG: class I adenylate-forming enzyme family protein [Chloroflexota bacterium]